MLNAQDGCSEDWDVGFTSRGIYCLLRGREDKPKCREENGRREDEGDKRNGFLAAD